MCALHGARSQFIKRGGAVPRDLRIIIISTEAESKLPGSEMGGKQASLRHRQLSEVTVCQDSNRFLKLEGTTLRSNKNTVTVNNVYTDSRYLGKKWVPRFPLHTLKLLVCHHRCVRTSSSYVYTCTVCATIFQKPPMNGRPERGEAHPEADQEHPPAPETREFAMCDKWIIFFLND